MPFLYAYSLQAFLLYPHKLKTTLRSASKITSKVISPLLGIILSIEKMENGEILGTGGIVIGGGLLQSQPNPHTMEMKAMIISTCNILILMGTTRLLAQVVPIYQ